MPRRTNDFQHLVKLVHQALAPAGAKVTESAECGDLREIDVLIESGINPYRVKIAVEAKDEGERLDVTDIEKVLGKYKIQPCPLVDKVVVVAHRGFTKRAKSKAAANGVELMTLDEVTESDLQDLLPHKMFPTGKHPLKYEMGPMLAHPKVVPLPTGVTNADALMKGQFICSCCGKNHGSPISFIQRLATSKRILKDPRYIQGLKQASAKGSSVCIQVGVGFPQYRLIMGTTAYPVQGVRFHLHQSRGTTEMEVESYRFSGDGKESRVIQRATAKVGGYRMEMVIPDGKHSQTIVVDFKRDCPDESPKK